LLKEVEIQPIAQLKPGRKITGISAILLPYSQDGEVDWARQGTRWACAIARAAVGRLDGPERDRLWAEITASDPVWQAAPVLGLDAGK
jgi:hypothetical protein